MQGTLTGVVIIGMLDNGLNLLGAPFYLQNKVRGVVMIAAVSLAVMRSDGHQLFGEHRVMPV